MTSLSLFRAEWRKISGNRPVIFFMIWIFPIGAVLLIALMALSMRALPPQYRSAPTWVEQFLSPWFFPTSEFGRLLMLGFTAVVFAGEYQWGTWKNILVRQGRTALILTKFLTINAFMLAAFILTSIVFGMGGIFIAAAAEQPYGPAVTGELLNGFLKEYLLLVATAIVTTTVGAGYAGVAAIFSRSILGGLMTAFGLVVIEGLLPLILTLLANLLRIPQIVRLYLLVPTYNIQNVGAWLRGDKLPAPSFGPVGVVVEPLSPEVSLVILALWVVGLIGLTAWLFRRQDITM